MARIISIPTSLLVEVDDDFDLDQQNADEVLMEYVLNDYGKYPTVDYRQLGYDNAEDLGEA